MFGKPTDDRSERAVADFCSAVSFFALRRGHSRDPHESSIQPIRTMSQCLSADCHPSRKRFSLARDASPWKIAGPPGPYGDIRRGLPRSALLKLAKRSRCERCTVYLRAPINELLSYGGTTESLITCYLGNERIFEFYKLKRPYIERIV